MIIRYFEFTLVTLQLQNQSLITLIDDALSLQPEK